MYSIKVNIINYVKSLNGIKTVHTVHNTVLYQIEYYNIKHFKEYTYLLNLIDPDRCYKGFSTQTFSIVLCVSPHSNIVLLSYHKTFGFFFSIAFLLAHFQNKSFRKSSVNNNNARRVQSIVYWFSVLSVKWLSLQVRKYHYCLHTEYTTLCLSELYVFNQSLGAHTVSNLLQSNVYIT